MTFVARRRIATRAIVLDRSLESLPIFRLSDSAEDSAISYSPESGGRWRVLVRIDQDDPITFRFQRLAGLRAGIIELAGLTDDDRPRSDDQDGGNVRASGHISARVGDAGRSPAIEVRVGRKPGRL